MNEINPATLPLRDIHLPESIGWWPPAPGWWIVVIATIIIIALLVRWWRRYQKQRKGWQQALAQLEQIRTAYQQQQDAQHTVRELSELLRRTAMSITSRQQAAGLTGDDWLAHLNKMTDNPCFDQQLGQLLVTAPYQPITQSNEQINHLIERCKSWIQQAHKTRSTKPEVQRA